MNKIIKIHGCSGAGKTTAVRRLMGERQCTPVHGSDLKIEAYYMPSINTYVLGSYENTCGGMDTVGDARTVCDLIDKYAPMGHVIHEGLLQSTYYGAMGKHSQDYGDRYIYAFLDTPLDICLERVVARRALSGRNNKFNPELTKDKWFTIQRLKEKLEKGIMGVKHQVVTLRHNEPMAPQLLELLK